MSIATNAAAAPLGRRGASLDRAIVIGLAMLVVLVLAGSLLVPGFLSVQNTRSILLLAAFLGIASLGQTLVALLGALDLSIPYVIGAANILLPAMMVAGLPPAAAIAVVAALGLACGMVNGLLSYRLQGQALIMSLGFGFAVVGAAQIWTSIGSQFGGTVFAQIPGWLRNLAAFNGTTFGLPVPPVIPIWIGIAVIAIWGMGNTWFGRGVYALGGSRVAASRLQISELRTWVLVHGISGLMSAITGMLLLGFSGGGFVGVGDPYLFTTVAAVVIGGTSLLGGSGGYGATVLGVLVLTVLTSLLVGLGLSFAAQQAVIGLTIVPMVAIYARAPHIRNQI
ncbi:ribose transport system permease protein [Pseudoxanthobacter soli DSM 19599]|uniref:Ribose transport system permease protein n=1 Tax=Pseudoxanthobacter soli DSM 19599 TaxID=1123029 RepID=A0A1M7ZKP6_9HYPH|nr:ABC transporter permease [Pseudoxanthobacter soli]SHO65480.1 ribose transport system permease protein [Pseudoxanthobacter soli DSM 19599]